MSQAGHVVSISTRRSLTASWDVHESHYDFVERLDPLGANSHQSKVVRQLNEALNYLGSEHKVKLIAVVPVAKHAIDIHDQDG